MNGLPTGLALTKHPFVVTTRVQSTKLTGCVVPRNHLAPGVLAGRNLPGCREQNYPETEIWTRFAADAENQVIVVNTPNTTGDASGACAG